MEISHRGQLIRQLLILSCLVLSHTATAKPQVVYNFGVVPQFESRVLFSIWQPVLKELEKRTGLGFRLVGSPKIPVFEKSFLAGKFDFAYTNPFHLTLTEDSQGYIPLVRDGSRMLQGVIVVRDDSPYQQLADLQNSVIAFPSPNALGASLATRASFNKSGLTSYTPKYVQTHSSVYLHVATGLADAGGGVLSTLQARPESVQQRIRVIHSATGIPTHPVCVHPRIPPAHRQKVQQALLEMSRSAEGKKLLARIPLYDAVQTDMTTYRMIREQGYARYYIKRSNERDSR